MEKELTIYLSQYIYEMYSDYLNKKRKQKNMPPAHGSGETPDPSSDPNEESKDAKGNLRTGDKYIIRKLVSMKIMPEQIQDFISLVASGTSNAAMNMNGYQMGSNNFAPSYTDNFMQVPQYNVHMRSNSCYATDSPMNLT